MQSIYGRYWQIRHDVLALLANFKIKMMVYVPYGIWLLYGRNTQWIDPKVETIPS